MYSKIANIDESVTPLLYDLECYVFLNNIVIQQILEFKNREFLGHAGQIWYERPSNFIKLLEDICFLGHQKCFNLIYDSLMLKLTRLAH